jgi:hypothetical protein
MISYPQHLSDAVARKAANEFDKQSVESLITLSARQKADDAEGDLLRLLTARKDYRGETHKPGPSEVFAAATIPTL